MNYSFWSPEADPEAHDGDDAARILTRELVTARRLGAGLLRHAECVAAAELNAACDEEAATSEALARADSALTSAAHQELHLLGHRTLTDVRAELVAAADALDGYVEARCRGYRERMRDGARALERALTQATAILDEAGLPSRPIP